jgi:hypothetical protein
VGPRYVKRCKRLRLCDSDLLVQSECGLYYSVLHQVLNFFLNSLLRFFDTTLAVNILTHQLRNHTGLVELRGQRAV